MALLQQRCVQFKGSNIDNEDQKTEQRAKKRRSKKDHAKAALARNADIRYFLYFLQITFDPGDLRRQMSGDIADCEGVELGTGCVDDDGKVIGDESTTEVEGSSAAAWIYTGSVIEAVIVFVNALN